MKSDAKSTITFFSAIHIPLSSFNHSGIKLGILPRTGTPHFIDSNGKVPNPDSSSIHIERQQSFKVFANSNSERPLISLKVIQRN